MKKQFPVSLTNNISFEVFSISELYFVNQARGYSAVPVRILKLNNF